MTKIQAITLTPPVQIIKIEIEDWERKKKAFLDYMNEHSKIEESYGVHTSYENLDDRLDRVLVSRLLREELKVLARDYLNVSSLKTSSWFQSQGKGQHHQAHHHAPGAQMASIIYLEYDSQFHLPTHFFAPNPFSGESVNWSDPDAKEGIWYLWPSSLMHYSLPCNHPDAPTRKIISININF